MIDGLKPYQDMKASGLSWLGDVPAHWEVRKLRHCGSISGGMTPSMADRTLWDGDVPWVTPKDMKRFTISSASMSVSAKALEATSLRLMPAGAVLMVVRGMILARRVPVARTDQPVTINQDMKAIVPHAGVDAGYLAYRLDAAQEAFVPLIDEAGHGTKRFPTERWMELQLALPPLDEQRLIVRFLDWHGSRTARLIRIRKKLIALLNEQRQAIIHRAVTRGLDPTVKLKPSGIPWLGDVPEGWEVKRLKNVCRINPSKLAIKSRSADELATFLPMERVSSDGKIDGSIQASISELANGFTYFERDDVILAKITPCFENGKGAVLDALPTEVGFGSTEFIVLRASREIDPRFLYLLTFEAQFRRLGVESMTGSAGQQRISQEFVANYCIALPGRDEQVRIIDALKAATREFDAVIDAALREITLIQEFRTRLIADVVTGKLDVREVAASLPETIEPEAEDISGDDLADGDDPDAADAETEEAAA